MARPQVRAVRKKRAARAAVDPNGAISQALKQLRIDSNAAITVLPVVVKLLRRLLDCVVRSFRMGASHCFEITILPGGEISVGRVKRVPSGGKRRNRLYQEGDLAALAAEFDRRLEKMKYSEARSRAKEVAGGGERLKRRPKAGAGL